MKYNINASGKGKLSADQKRSALWSKCAAKFGKVAKCAAGAKSLRTTALGDITTCFFWKYSRKFSKKKRLLPPLAIFCISHAVFNCD